MKVDHYGGFRRRGYIGNKAVWECNGDIRVTFSSIEDVNKNEFRVSGKVEKNFGF
jgi:hypothetical protein